jgi:hypothetical protein
MRKIARKEKCPPKGRSHRSEYGGFWGLRGHWFSIRYKHGTNGGKTGNVCQLYVSFVFSGLGGFSSGEGLDKVFAGAAEVVQKFGGRPALQPGGEGGADVIVPRQESLRG